jgi:HD-like signal output (HDOD) protein
VRFILSGSSDNELVMKCVGCAHQYLSKPCTPETLRTAISRATKLHLSLEDGAIRRLVSQLDRLPSLPRLYTELVDALADPDVRIETVASIISRDIGMTTKILKLVNSAFFGMGREITDPSEAVMYLGEETVKSLALSIRVFSQYELGKSGSLSMDLLWEHSLLTANAARSVAAAACADHKLAEEAFLAGMLHDAGRLVLAANLTEQYSKVVELAQREHLELVQAEQQVFRATHAEVGGYLLGLWGLPMPVVEAITFHHSPSLSEATAFNPLTAVHVANALVQEQAVVCNGVVPAAVDLEFLEALGLSDQLDGWRQAVDEPVLQGEFK